MFLNNEVEMSITYEVRRITEKDVENRTKRTVTAVIEKKVESAGYLSPTITVFKVYYTVWGDKHMINSVDTLPPAKSLDNNERIGVADALKFYN